MKRPSSKSLVDEHDPRWSSVLRRDRRDDGRFVFAVATTGVFCRPSCGARTPRRENVSFFDAPDAAIAAGYRACKRCLPTEPTAAERDAAMVRRLTRFIDEATTPPRLAELAAHVGLSPSHVHRTFAALTGLTPRAYAAARRKDRLQRELMRERPVSAAMYDAGYGAPSRLYADADRALGMKPKTYRDGAPATTIGFSFGRSTLGVVLVARTSVGVCAISLGDDEPTLHRALRERFPHATLVRETSEIEAVVADVISLVEDPTRTLDLPLDVKGTVFQERVWQALRALPVGTTTTYTALATSLGDPRAVRAVAGACAKNSIALAIPCHRVIREDGALAGYRWGIARKQELLAREAALRERR